MKMQECSSWNNCDAPLCPLDEDVTGSRWFPDDSICKSQSQKNPFIKIQRKIIKKIKDENINTYFMLDMLNKLSKIGKGVKGIDPDKDETEETEKWMRKALKFKKITKMTDEAKKALRNRLATAKNRHAL